MSLAAAIIQRSVEVFAVDFFFFEPLAVVVDLFSKGGRTELGDGLLRLEVVVFLDEKFFDKVMPAAFSAAGRIMAGARTPTSR